MFSNLLLRHCYRELNTAHQLFAKRCFSTSLIRCKRYGPIGLGEEPVPKRNNFKENLLPIDWQKFIDKYPEFLPDPINNSPFLVMRMIDDMLQRRAVFEIPEFYVGSILAVTTSDQYSQTKQTKFVGICIQRSGQMKYANFTLRNVIDGMGVEIRYDLYSPLILNIQVLRLEKRLDNTLVYLRDALPEYSTIPEDMKPVALEADSEVPMNKTLVKMKPQPWSRRWERHLLKGIEKFEDIPEWFAQKVKTVEDDPVYSYDLMLDYRQHVTEEMMYNICKRLAEHEKTVVEVRKATKGKRFLRVSSLSAAKTIQTKPSSQ